MASSSNGLAAFTEANVEAHDFRLDFAQETLQSFKRDRSRSPLQIVPLSNTARAALDVVYNRDKEARIDAQRTTIARLQQELAAKDARIASQEYQLGLRDTRVASLESRLAHKKRIIEILDDRIYKHTHGPQWYDQPASQ
jgi:uncharacterized coiled-coil protein SlyX